MSCTNPALYIHIPFCISKCQYCDFFSIGGSKDVSQSYVDSLCGEIKERAKACGGQSWKSVYIGGGTPSLLSSLQIKQILDAVKNAAVLSEQCEVTIEANPDDITKEFLLGLESAGINRISVGIQSFSDKALSFCKRRANVQKNKEALSLINKFWKHRFSVDLICGLPFETEQSFVEGLSSVISYNPDHISMYSLTFEDETPFGKLLNQKKLDYDFEFSDSLWLKGREFLEQHGYLQYEVSNFCKPGNESAHNLCYWNHKSYLGCGSGATGTLYAADGSALRYTNTTDIKEYVKSAVSTCQTENIDVKTSIVEYFMMGLRKISGVNEEDFNKCFGISAGFPSYVKTLSASWQKKGLCQMSEQGFTLGKSGILYLNRFILELLDLSDQE